MLRLLLKLWDRLPTEFGPMANVQLTNRGLLGKELDNNAKLEELIKSADID